MPHRTANVHWWTTPLVGRIFVTVIFWVLVTVGVVFLACSLYMLAVPEERDWNQIVGGLIYLPVVWLSGRAWVTAIAIEDDAILVCRAFPGRAERIPLSSIRSVRARRSWVNTSLVIWAGGRLPLMLCGDAWWWFGVAPWDTLISALREKLEPLGKWRE
jgi:hypothetical protein